MNTGSFEIFSKRKLIAATPRIFAVAAVFAAGFGLTIE
jgi:hypothetical protein